MTRPPESRLFRPTDSFEDLSTMTLSLQEALAREKMLEDKLVQVKSMISKNIGKSHTDLLRLFENIKEELMNLYEQRDLSNSNGAGCKESDHTLEKLGAEIHALKKEIKNLESILGAREQEVEVLQKKSSADDVELKTLRKACQLQKDDLFNMELKLQRASEESGKLKTESESAINELMKSCEKKIAEKESELDKEQKTMRERMTEILSNEGNLLNRYLIFNPNFLLTMQIS